MLSAAITLLFIAAALLALAVIAHSFREAYAAWERLMREGEVLREGIALQPSAAGETRMRGGHRAAFAHHHAFVMRRPVGLQPFPLRACAAA